MDMCGFINAIAANIIVVEFYSTHSALPIGSCILFRQQTHVPTGYYQRADRRQF